MASVQSCMSTTKLKLNPDKTEFILIGNERQWNKYLTMFPIELFGVKTNPQNSAQNLGSNIWQICHLSLTFISRVQLTLSPNARSAAFHRYFDLDSIKLPPTVLVSSCLHYCNSLLYSIADTELTSLNKFRIDWPTSWQSHLHLFTVFPCFIPFIGCSKV